MKPLHFLCIAIGLVVATMPAAGQVFVSEGATWDYFAPATAAEAPAAEWKSQPATPQGWLSGAARIGYGGDGEVTLISTANGKPFTVYFRTTFQITDLAAVTDLRLSLVRDDGAVIYINGVEKWRSNMPATGEITFNTPANAVVGNADETADYIKDLPASDFTAGTNLIAVEVHQRDATSSDLGFDLEIRAAPPASFLTYDFDNGGTLADYGWSTVSEDANTAFAVLPQYGTTGNSLSPPQAGSGAVFQSSWDNRDTAHTTLWVRSPRFRLNGDGDLRFYLIGGNGGTAALPARESEVSATSVLDGFLFAALRDAATGTFVLRARKPGANPFPSTWQHVVFTQAELAALDQNATYTLDVIDARHVAATGQGGWGWFAFDSVSIPGTTANPPPLENFRILSIVRDPEEGGITLTWPGTAGVSYRIQRSTTLSGWQNIGAVLPGISGNMTGLDPNPPAGEKRVFYRVLIP